VLPLFVTSFVEISFDVRPELDVSRPRLQVLLHLFHRWIHEIVDSTE
jgi:hypothetical protein